MKNLPIKLFEKRKLIDDRKPEGGGNSDLPKWANLTEEELKERTDSFLVALTATTEWLDQRNKATEFIPAILKLNIDERALAKSHRPDIADIFNGKDEQNIIGLVNNVQLLVKVNSAKDVDNIKAKIQNQDKNLKAIAAITELSNFVAEVSVDISHEDKSIAPLRASLINYQDYQLNQAVCRVFEKECEKNNITYKKANYSPELIIYRLGNITTDSLRKIESFEALETLTEMPQLFVEVDSLTESTKEEIPIKYPEKGKQYAVVGVLDSGIKSIPHLAPWLLPNPFSKVPDDRKDESHGTFVAGRIIYGDQLDGLLPCGSDGCYLFDAAVIPDKSKDTIEESDLIDHLREAVSTNKEIKIWNLCLGTRTEADKHSFSPFGIALDQIQIENEVLICKSAGNCTNFRHGYPVSRISKAADSVLSLVVGSVAHAKGSFDIAEINHPSPFSRIGHGPSYINKPELTHFGGNVGISPYNGSQLVTGVKSFHTDGSISADIGTSFSTPRVTALVAGLHNSLSETFNPLLLKALSIHSAKYPLNLALPPDQRIKTMGYGIPDSLSNILYNDENEITLILQDTLEKGNWIQMLDFPFPPELIDNGKFYGEVIVTLATMPMFGEKQGGEYCQSNLEVRFGTHDGVRRTDRVSNPLSHQDGQNLLRGALYGAGYRKGVTGTFAQERTLVQYGDKFHPIKKYAINLEEMTPGNSDRFLTAPKHWYLEIEGLFRDYICGRSIVDGIVLSQEYCLIITIRDNKKMHNVYNSTTNLLNARGFVHNNINLKSDIRVSVS